VGGPVRRGALACAVALSLLLAGLAACDRPRTRGHSAQWDEHWRDLARSGPHWRPGVELVVVTREGRPEGARATRERWVLLRRDSVEGQFERQRDGASATVVAMPFHPDGPSVVIGYGGRARHGRYAYATGFENVHVPAGRFRCGRTWRTVQEHDGRVMRVDEWWSPGVPVPVQTWKRWEGVIDTLYSPPHRAADVRVGTTWAVLESIRRP
jgi:hypothetical protein